MKWIELILPLPDIDRQVIIAEISNVGENKFHYDIAVLKLDKDRKYFEIQGQAQRAQTKPENIAKWTYIEDNDE